MLSGGTNFPAPPSKGTELTKVNSSTGAKIQVLALPTQYKDYIPSMPGVTVYEQTGMKVTVQTGDKDVWIAKPIY